LAIPGQEAQLLKINERTLFSDAVADAVEEVPEEFQRYLENVEIFVEDFADANTLNSLGMDSPWQLLGLYVGVPHDRKSVFYVAPVPDRIFLYRRPILHAAGRKESIMEKIREVLIHEIGHHFGFSEKQLEEMEGRTD
jgi:predicted Zn-dependent protease with MMP-like domain